jgi:hypothetical protein
MQPKRHPDRALFLQAMPTMWIRHVFLFILESFFFSIVIPDHPTPSARTPLQPDYLLFLKKLNSICEN